MNTSEDKNNIFVTWVDPEIKEVLCIEQEYMTSTLLNQLSKEGVKVEFIEAQNRKLALEIFIHTFAPHLNSNIDLASSTNDNELAIQAPKKTVTLH